jgi:uncharacterized protein
MSVLPLTSQLATSSPLRRFITHHSLVAYFVLAFAGAWIIWLPLVLAKNGFGVFPYTFPSLQIYILEVLGTFMGPTLSAFLLTAVVSGKTGLRQLLHRYVQGRIGVQWYLLVLLGIPFLVVVAASLSSILFGATSLSRLSQSWPELAVLYLPFVVVNVLGGPLGEEPGWRGFALPRLQQRYGAALGSLLLGLLWGLWHVPLFLVVGAKGPFSFPGFAFFVLGTVIFAVYFTWLYNHSGGNLLLMILLHAALNTNSSVVVQLALFFPRLSWTLYIVYAAGALLLLLFTRGSLSYQPDLQAAPVEVEQRKETSVL